MMVDLGTCWVRAEDVRIIHRCVDHDGNMTRGAKVVLADGKELDISIGADEVAARVNQEPVNKFQPAPTYDEIVRDAEFFAKES